MPAVGGAAFNTPLEMQYGWIDDSLVEIPLSLGFQYSIGDACFSTGSAISAIAVLSILHWRCAISKGQ